MITREMLKEVAMCCSWWPSKSYTVIRRPIDFKSYSDTIQRDGKSYNFTWELVIGKVWRLSATEITNE